MSDLLMENLGQKSNASKIENNFCILVGLSGHFMKWKPSKKL